MDRKVRNIRHKVDKNPEKIFNLIGLGIDLNKDRSTKKIHKKKNNNLSKTININNDNMETEDISCVICGSEMNGKTFSCKGCGMEFNMEEKEARHMISLMIGVFWADGVLDEQEKEGFKEYIEKIRISSEIKKKLKKEIYSPRKLKNIIRWIKSPTGKRNTIRIATLSAMVNNWNKKEIEYIEEAKKLLGLKTSESNNIIKQVKDYMAPLMI